MPTLYLLRHAKSDRSDPDLADHERPLAARGRRAAPAMGDYMRSEGLVPEIVLCSTAARTRETWNLMADKIGRRSAVIWEDQLYGASRGDILRILDRIDDDAGPVLVVGHNPGLEDTARALAGSGDPDARARMAEEFPTGALAVLECDVRGWDRLEGGCCSLERFVRPADLEDADGGA